MTAARPVLATLGLVLTGCSGDNIIAHYTAPYMVSAYVTDVGPPAPPIATSYHYNRQACESEASTTTLANDLDAMSRGRRGYFTWACIENPWQFGGEPSAAQWGGAGR